MDSQMEPMEQGVLAHLMALEREGMGQQNQHQSERLEMLKVRALTLRAKRDQLKRQTDAIKILKDKISKDLPLQDDVDAGGFIEMQQSLLTAWRMQLKDLQRAHHLIGGYDLVECKEGKSVCVSFHTVFEGVYLDTYNMELDLTRTVQISRHNIPPSLPLESFAKQNLQKDLKAFLQTLSQNLNALAGRRQQVSLVKNKARLPELFCAHWSMEISHNVSQHVSALRVKIKHFQNLHSGRKTSRCSWSLQLIRLS